MSINFSIPNIPSFSSLTPNKGQILFIPDIKYLVRFANGDLGIADSVKKSMIMRNLSSIKSTEQFEVFAKAAGIKLSNDPQSYLKNGKLIVPISDLILDPSTDTSGLKALEKSLIQSIFESQKPYMEIAKLVTENFVRIEDIIARILAITGSSRKPKGNPKALGYQPSNDIPLNKALSKLDSIQNIKPKSTSLDGSSKSTNKNPKSGDGGDNGLDKKNYTVVSTVYSTGEFDPTAKYDYEYIDIKDNSLLESDLSDSNVSLPDNESGDPYKGSRPNSIVFGIFNSKGQPLEVIPDWLVKSGKWYGQFSNISNLSYIWTKFGHNDSIGSTPPDDKGGWETKKVKKKVRVNGGDIKEIEQPIIVDDVTLESNKNYYTNYFKEYTIDSLANKKLTQTQKDTALKEVLSRLDVKGQIENLNTNSFLSGVQLSSGSFPMGRSAFRPKKLPLPNKSIWVDPESEYDMKVIKIDSSKDIKFLETLGKPELSTQIIRFIKKTLSIVLSDGSRFNGVLKTGELLSKTEFTFENAPEFVLDNPTVDKYTLTIKLSKPPLSLINGTSFVLSNGNIANLLKDNDKYKFTESTVLNQSWISASSGSIEVSNAPGGITRVDYTNGIVTLFYIGTSKTEMPKSWSEINFSFSWVIESKDKTKTFYNLSNSNGKILLKTKQSNLVEAFSNPSVLKLPSGITIELKNGYVTSWNVFHDRNILQYIPTSDLVKNTVIIDINDFSNIKVVSKTIPPNEIRVKETNNPFGKLIDNKQVTNDQLATKNLYSKGIYGSSIDGSLQTIDQIYRFMKSEDDIETYYIIEGVLPSNNKNTFPVDGATNPPSSQDTGGGYYRFTDFFGAIKVFIDMVIDIFTKIIPAIQTLIDLISNPASFIVNDVILKKLGDNNKLDGIKFNFLSGDFISKFSQLESMSPKDRKDFVKGSQLRNYVFVSDVGDYRFLLDGSALTSIFGITFGINLTNLIPSLIFSRTSAPSDKTLKSFLGLPNEKICKNNRSNTNLGSKEGSVNQIKTSSNGTEHAENVSIQYSTGRFIKGVDYEYIYVSQYISGLLKEAGDLENSDIDKALIKYKEALSKDPDNTFIKNKIEELDKAGNTTQPLLDFMLDMTTFPLKVIKGIIDYIMDFFKSLSNPFELVDKVLEFVSFKWIIDFFEPTNLLNLIGIKFDIPTFNSWLSNIDSYPKDHMFDLSSIIDLPFMPKLFSVNPEQLKLLSKSPISMLNSILCLIENIVNGFIDFIWAIFGLESILEPPHIKLCKDTNGDLSLSDLLDVLNGNYVDSLSNGKVGKNKVGSDGSKGNYDFTYEIKLPDGRNVRDLNREELRKFIDEHGDIQYDFKF
jgi:hypothetical protein